MGPACTATASVIAIIDTIVTEWICGSTTSSNGMGSRRVVVEWIGAHDALLCCYVVLIVDCTNCTSTLAKLAGVKGSTMTGPRIFLSWPDFYDLFKGEPRTDF